MRLSFDALLRHPARVARSGHSRFPRRRSLCLPPFTPCRGHDAKGRAQTKHPLLPRHALIGPLYSGETGAPFGDRSTTPDNLRDPNVHSLLSYLANKNVAHYGLLNVVANHTALADLLEKGKELLQVSAPTVDNRCKTLVSVLAALFYELEDGTDDPNQIPYRKCKSSIFGNTEITAQKVGPGLPGSVLETQERDVETLQCTDSKSPCKKDLMTLLSSLVKKVVIPTEQIDVLTCRLEDNLNPKPYLGYVFETYVNNVKAQKTDGFSLADEAVMRESCIRFITTLVDQIRQRLPYKITVLQEHHSYRSKTLCAS
ncbi:hypothetical protein HPB48_000716 [Haemaphysalis longicornis]|uniref:Uncharacterized protein n=1 Tax=Haemaphysalis longicornis TaxID=44386 RepID=A0A9J6GKM9_HAELO|nr:hypothetical protein HPB48_000716 [Haemaphysalis longicornis]